GVRQVLACGSRQPALLENDLTARCASRSEGAAQIHDGPDCFSGRRGGQRLDRRDPDKVFASYTTIE
ncbi:MAG: hypothetical protein ACXWI6_19145, partial [Burkholderiales bacterium]